MNAQTVQNLKPDIPADSLTFFTHWRPKRHVAFFRWAVEIGSCASYCVAAKPAFEIDSWRQPAGRHWDDCTNKCRNTCPTSYHCAFMRCVFWIFHPFPGTISEPPSTVW